MEKSAVREHFPEFERASALSASMMLGYVLAEFIEIPGRVISLESLGLVIEISLNTQLLSAVMMSGLAITGTLWLLHGRPGAAPRTTGQHWVLPGLTALVLSISLSVLPGGIPWWIALTAGTGFLSLVWLAEYITVDPQDRNFRAAANGLTALAFALYLILAIVLRARGTRLVFLIPAVSLPVIGITGRYIILRLQAAELMDRGNANTALLAAGTVGVGAGQVATALHFLPFSPLSFGLALLSPLYAASILFGDLVDGRPLVRTIVEPLLIMGLLWLIAIWLR